MTNSDRDTLAQALTTLIAAQATMENAQATIVQTQAILTQSIANMQARFMQIDEKFAQIMAILMRHEQLLNNLPDAIRDKIGFKPNANPNL